MEKPEKSAEKQRYGWLQAACCLVAAGLGLASYSPDFGLLALTNRTPAVRARLELRLVHDSSPLFLPNATQGLPAGVSILSEMTRATGEATRQQYARLVLQNGESFSEAHARIETWLASLQVPQGKQLVWQHELPDDYRSGFDDAGRAEPLDDFRSYVVDARPVLTARNVQSVEVTANPEDGFVSTVLRLDSDGAARVERTTSAHVHERLALLVNGFVITAPVIRQALSGGVLQISPGGDDPEETRKRAEALKQQLEAPAPN